MKTFIIEQKITAFANQYRVYEVGQDGNRGSLIAFAHQKRIAFKERIDFFSDEKRQNLAFAAKAEKVMDIHGKFIIIDPTGARLGAIKKAFKQSLLRSTWEMLNSDDKPSAIVTERSVELAVLRRVWDFIPVVSSVPFLFKYHFDFLIPGTEQVIGSYSKTKLIRDYYQLDVEDSLVDNVGWQTLVAQAVLLDALQGR